MEALPTPVLRSDELAAESIGEPNIRRVDVAGEPVLVARLSAGGVVAFAATCPHQDTSLDDATFWDGKLRCPRHLYLYDPGSGENLIPARDARPENLWKLKPGYLPVYPVEERDGWIWVTPTPKPPPAAYDPAQEERPPTRSGIGPPPTRSPAPVAPTGPIQPARGLLAPALAAPPAAMASTGAAEQPRQTLRVRDGSTFELRLETTPKPGFLWRVHLSGPLLAVVEERFDPADSRHKIKLAARGQGETSLQCVYARPWDTVPAEVRTYAVEIDPA
jgi:nitrite reductase/ring-hydroxylating ferredoxin subunit/predicted secreted protein